MGYGIALDNKKSGQMIFILKGTHFQANYLTKEIDWVLNYKTGYSIWTLCSCQTFIVKVIN